MPTALARKPFRLQYPYADHAVIPPGECDPDSRDGRIASVMPLIVKKLNEFRKSIRADELGQFDLTDLVQEVWLELAEKDHYFDQARAKYITFANMIVQQKLADIRNRWHIVPGPRDTVQQLRLAGSTPKLEAIRRTIRNPESLDDREPGPEPTAVDELTRRDAAAAAKSVTDDAISRLSNPIHIRIIMWSFGLSGSAPKPVAEIAGLIGRTTAQVISARREAIREMGDLMTAMRFTL